MKPDLVLFDGTAAFADDLFAQYQANRNSVSPDWQAYFDGLQADDLSPPATEAGSNGTLELVRAYRTRGHLAAQLDPLSLEPAPDRKELQPAAYGLSDSEQATLVESLKRTYCGNIGYEYMHLGDSAQVAWLQARIEGGAGETARSPAKKLEVLNQLIEVKGYERYLDKKFPGSTRFGLDGAESAIPALEQIIRQGAALGVSQVVIGMAHRGRLNVLSQVMGKPHRAIFNEFKGGSSIPPGVAGSSDVKYHLGASRDQVFDGKSVHLSLLANPSHLEISDPVVLGQARAKQDQQSDRTDRTSVLPLLIHGDAAFAGQGVVAECFALSGMEGYRAGGSIHLIINNQIGFTTDPRDSRPSPYPSDVAKGFDVPIFHVNGDDPEAVIKVAQIAIEFRQRFHQPVVIDLVCFRQYGHNEGDEPSFTQPRMYRAIRAHLSTLEIYGNRLIAENLTTQAEIDQKRSKWTAYLDQEFEAGQSYQPSQADWLEGRWSGLGVPQNHTAASVVATGLSLSQLSALGAKLTEIPAGFVIHPTVQRFLDNRRKMIEAGTGLDWSAAEALAFGSLLGEGVPVRLSGQDVERGTFSQRHAVLINQADGARFTPLNHLREGQAQCEVVNSLLSEEAVLGFEYGYTQAEPQALVLWEAQYGDFANGAQVVFDQFISSAERKWLRISGLVCLLPHGYEGQGPEHSSARLERFLQNSAEDNWYVANCSTPANYFHILRRQLKQGFRRPLILMTPKSLLRHALCKSPMTALAEGTSFLPVLRDDSDSAGAKAAQLAGDAQIRRVLVCSGRVYYDLFEERKKRSITEVYLLRIEQLYPFPAEAVAQELSRFKAAEIVWCQEEPQNMGAWTFLEPHLESTLASTHGHGRRARYIGRAASASTSAGIVSEHLAQLKELLSQALA